jgi:hypothetical protein
MRRPSGIGLSQSQSRAPTPARSLLRALHQPTLLCTTACHQTRSRGGGKSRWLGPGPLRCLFCSRSILCRKERTYSPTVQLAPAVNGRGGLARGGAGGAGGAARRRGGEAAAWWRRRGGGGRLTNRCEAVRACLLWPCWLYLPWLHLRWPCSPRLYLLWHTAARLYARAVRKEPLEKPLKLEQPRARRLSSKWYY